MYHCNYCSKDVTGKIHFKCAICPDFDLCVECFSVGAEVTPHKSHHPYRVMDNLSFPLISPDWNADDEILLLEGIEMHGLGKWAEVAEHVGTKTEESCIKHYKSVYLNSPFFPVPDMSHVVGKNRKELIAMAIEQREEKKGLSRSITSHSGPSGNTRAKQKPSYVARGKGGPGVIEMKGSQIDRDFVGKKSTCSENEGPSLVESSGYNAKRQEFDIEYDNDAELLVAEMEFTDADTEEERELKLRVFHSYSRRVDERQRRKDFILERNLLYPNPFEKDLTPEEKTICHRYDAFMRFHTKEEHDELLTTVISEHRTCKRLQELKEARAAGCRNSAEADRYLLHKRTRGGAEESVDGTKRSNNQGIPSASISPKSTGKDLSTGPADLLSEPEKRLCSELRLLPTVYIKMQEQLAMQILAGTVSSRLDARKLFKMEATKIDKVYDMLIKKGFGSP
ncbi:Transcriptional adapter ADA2b, partial [Mucuna pruriens]